MDKVLDNLKEKSILHQNQVLKVRKYIDEKFPDSSVEQKAGIFANAVYQIVDESVDKFQEQHRLQIRSDVLKSAIAKDLFEIDGFDVFEVCSNISVEASQKDMKFFETLTEWVNDNQDEVITLEDTKSMATTIVNESLPEMINYLEDATVEYDKPLEDHYIDEANVDFVEANRNDDIMEEANTEDTVATHNEAIEAGMVDEVNELEDFVEDEYDEDSFDSMDLVFAEPLVEEDADNSRETDRRSKDKDKDKDKGRDKGKDKGNSKSKDKGKDKSKDKGKDKSKDKGKDKSKDKGKDKDKSKDNNKNKSKDKGNDSSGSWPKTSDDWNETHVELKKKVESTRLNGYDLKRPDFNNVENETQRAKTARMLLLIPVALITIMVIIVLIVGAIEISKSVHKEEIIPYEEVSVNMLQAIDIKSDKESYNKEVVEIEPEKIPGVNYLEGEHLHKDLQYKSIKEIQLKEYLVEKKSYLAGDDYIDTFIQVAKDYNVNPLLLVAITGQEQNFVPKEHENASEIANNPFNVYQSWKKYNTNFEDAAKIAARTILSSSEGRPEDEDPIKWINNRYAEDENWHRGVQYFFEELTSICSEV